MQNSNFRPSKAMGQNFLNDANIIRKIVRLSGIDETCGVLEVGPGYGALTKYLAEAAGHVTAVELDKRLMTGLRGVFEKYPNVTLVQGDILKEDIKKLAMETLPEQSRHVCANLPYSITTPAITRFCDAGIFETITVMVQREVAKRISAKPGSPEYGAFTVFTNYHTVPETLFDIPPSAFIPRPKVTSSVVKMTVRKKRALSGDDEEFFFRTVRAAFGQRRKTLLNALHSVLKNTHSKEAVAEAVRQCGFGADIRGEKLSPDEFISLSAALRLL